MLNALLERLTWKRCDVEVAELRRVYAHLEDGTPVEIIDGELHEGANFMDEGGN